MERIQNRQHEVQSQLSELNGVSPIAIRNPKAHVFLRTIQEYSSNYSGKLDSDIHTDPKTELHYKFMSKCLREYNDNLFNGGDFVDGDIVGNANVFDYAFTAKDVNALKSGLQRRDAPLRKEHQQVVDNYSMLSKSHKAVGSDPKLAHMVRDYNEGFQIWEQQTAALTEHVSDPYRESINKALEDTISDFCQQHGPEKTRAAFPGLVSETDPVQLKDSIAYVSTNQLLNILTTATIPRLSDEAYFQSDAYNCLQKHFAEQGIKLDNGALGGMFQSLKTRLGGVATNATAKFSPSEPHRAKLEEKIVSAVEQYMDLDKHANSNHHGLGEDGFRAAKARGKFDRLVTIDDNGKVSLRDSLRELPMDELNDLVLSVYKDDLGSNASIWGHGKTTDSQKQLHQALSEANMSISHDGLFVATAAEDAKKTQAIKAQIVVAVEQYMNLDKHQNDGLDEQQIKEKTLEKFGRLVDIDDGGAITLNEEASDLGLQELEELVADVYQKDLSSSASIKGFGKVTDAQIQLRSALAGKNMDIDKGFAAIYPETIDYSELQQAMSRGFTEHKELEAELSNLKHQINSRIKTLTKSKVVDIQQPKLPDASDQVEKLARDCDVYVRRKVAEVLTKNTLSRGLQDLWHRDDWSIRNMGKAAIVDSVRQRSQAIIADAQQRAMDKTKQFFLQGLQDPHNKLDAETKLAIEASVKEAFSQPPTYDPLQNGVVMKPALDALNKIRKAFPKSDNVHLNTYMAKVNEKFLDFYHNGQKINPKELRVLADQLKQTELLEDKNRQSQEAKALIKSSASGYKVHFRKLTEQIDNPKSNINLEQIKLRHLIATAQQKRDDLGL